MTDETDEDGEDWTPHANELPAKDIAEGDDPWADWLEAVGIGPGFPMLRSMRKPYADKDELGRERPTEDSKRWFLNRPHLLKLQEIYESLTSSRVVTTSPGHGATTLARYLYLRAAEDSIIRRSIPVLISLEDMLPEVYDDLVAGERRALRRMHEGMALRRFRLDRKPDESQIEYEDRVDDQIEHFREKAEAQSSEVFSGISAKMFKDIVEERVHSSVVRSLLTRPWERAIPRAKYRDLLNADSQRLEDLVARRTELARFVVDNPIGEPSWRQLSRLAPKLRPDDYRTLISELNDVSNVRISLLVDLSATPLGRVFVDDKSGEVLTDAYVDVLGRANQAMKNIEQVGADGPVPTLPSLLDKTFFMSGDAWRAFEADYTEQQNEVIEFPAFRPIDVFAMLAHHYPPHQDESGRRAEALAAVVDSAFVQISPRTAVSSETAILQAELEHLVSTEGDVTYQLQQRPPDEGQISTLVHVIYQLAKDFPSLLNKLEVEFPHLLSGNGFNGADS